MEDMDKKRKQKTGAKNKERFLKQLKECSMSELTICGHPVSDVYEFMRTYYEGQKPEFFDRRYRLRHYEDAATVAENDLLYNDDCRKTFIQHCEDTNTRFIIQLTNTTFEQLVINILKHSKGGGSKWHGIRGAKMNG